MGTDEVASASKPEGVNDEEQIGLQETILDAFRKQEETLRRLRFEVMALQRAKRENIRLAEESLPDDDVTEIIDMNLRIFQNMRRHKTDAFITASPGQWTQLVGKNKEGQTEGAEQQQPMVLRRGEEVVCEVKSADGIKLMEEKLDGISLHMFEIRNAITVDSGTTAAAHIQKASCHVDAYEDKACHIIYDLKHQICNDLGFVKFKFGNNFPIGRYLVRLLGETKEYKKMLLAQFEIVLLFNPFQLTDEVYMDDDDLEEYVLREHGTVCVGHLTRTWYFGQHEPCSLEAVMFLLRSCPLKQRASAVAVARWLSEECDVYNTKLAERACLLPSNASDFPFALNGSVEIFSAYRRIMVRDKYGAKNGSNTEEDDDEPLADTDNLWGGRMIQEHVPSPTWVFSAILVSLLRCTGIPSRTLTIMDTPGRNAYQQCILGGILAVDKLFNAKGEYVRWGQHRTEADGIRAKKAHHHALADLYVNGEWHIVDCADGNAVGPLASSHIYTKTFSGGVHAKPASDDTSSGKTKPGVVGPVNTAPLIQLERVDQSYFRRLLNGDVRYFQKVDGGEWTFIHSEDRGVGERIHVADKDLDLATDIRMKYYDKLSCGKGGVDVLQKRDADNKRPCSAGGAAQMDVCTVECDKVQEAGTDIWLTLKVDNLSSPAKVSISALKDDYIQLKCQETDVTTESNTAKLTIGEADQIKVLQQGHRTLEFVVLAYRTGKHEPVAVQVSNCVELVDAIRKTDAADEEEAAMGGGASPPHVGGYAIRHSDSSEPPSATRHFPFYAITRFVELKLPVVELDYVFKGKEYEVTINFTNTFKSTNLHDVRIKATIAGNSCSFEGGTKRDIVIAPELNGEPDEDAPTDATAATKNWLKSGQKMTHKLKVIPSSKNSIVLIVTLDCFQFGKHAGANASVRLEQ